MPHYWTLWPYAWYLCFSLPYPVVHKPVLPKFEHPDVESIIRLWKNRNRRFFEPQWGYCRPSLDLALINNHQTNWKIQQFHGPWEEQMITSEIQDLTFRAYSTGGSKEPRWLENFSKWKAGELWWLPSWRNRFIWEWQPRVFQGLASSRTQKRVNVEKVANKCHKALVAHG